MRTRNWLSRHGIGAVGIAAATILVMSGCAPAGAEAPAGPAEAAAGGSGTFKVGLLASTTGFAAAMGTEMKMGWDLYWEEKGGMAGGYTIESVFEDDASDAATALTKAGRLVTEENVDVVVGPILANNSLAVADYLDQQGVANLSQTSADDITQREFSPLVLRTGAQGGSQTTYAGGQWAYDEGHRTAATICVDYAFGWDSCGGFVSAFTAAGGTVEQQLWYPGNATDLSTYVAQLMSSGTDIVFAGTTGGTDGSNFLRSASDFGLLESTPVLTGCCSTSVGTLGDVGDIALGVNSVSYFAEGSDESAAFTAAFEAKYSAIPSGYAVGAYATAQMLDAALTEAEEKPTGEDLIAAIKAADTTGNAFGEVSFDDYNNLVGPVFIRTVEERDDGELWNVVAKKYDDVNQFWSFEAEEFLSNPTFSQTYTGEQ